MNETLLAGVSVERVTDDASHDEADAASSCSGQGELMRALEDHPVCAAERAAIPRGFDHAFLARYEGTDLVQWHARSNRGSFYPFGSLMRISGAALNGEE